MSIGKRGRQRRWIGVSHEAYHEELLRVHAICDGRTLVFSEQMMLMARACLAQHALMSNDTGMLDTIDPPDEQQNDTPAGRVLAMVLEAGTKSEEMLR